MSMYALINFDSGEIYSIEGENITCQYLYKKALSIRRKNIYYGYKQDKLHLIKCSNYKNIMNGTIIQEWEGGLDTPLVETGLTVRAYYSIIRRSEAKTIGEAIQHIENSDFFNRNGNIVLQHIIKIVKIYDENAAKRLTKIYNKTRRAKNGNV